MDLNVENVNVAKIKGIPQKMVKQYIDRYVGRNVRNVIIDGIQGVWQQWIGIID